MFRRDEKGQVVVEYAIVFPIQLLVTLAIIQLAHIFVAKHVVGYAAFCGARAEIVGEDPKDAASLALSMIAGTTGATEPNIEIPGWGEMTKSGAAREKTTVNVTSEDAGNVTLIKCDVEHQLELAIPLGNYLAYTIGEVFLSLDDADDTYGAPHIVIKGTSTLVRPWD